MSLTSDRAYSAHGADIGVAVGPHGPTAPTAHGPRNTVEAVHSGDSDAPNRRRNRRDRLALIAAMRVYSTCWGTQTMSSRQGVWVLHLP